MNWIAKPFGSKIDPYTMFPGSILSVLCGLLLASTLQAENVHPQRLPNYAVYATSAMNQIERGSFRVSRPRYEASGMPAPSTQILQRIYPPFQLKETDLGIPTVQEVFFFTEKRPVRIRLHLHVLGRSLTQDWQDRLREFFRVLDRDDDGYLNAFEAEYIYSNRALQQMVRTGLGYPNYSESGRSLADLDKDQDGQISPDEFIAYYQPTAASLITVRPNSLMDLVGDRLTDELFAKLDTNKDDKLSQSELLAAELLLAKLDANEDECLSANEIYPDVFQRVRKDDEAAPPMPLAKKEVPSNRLFLYPAGQIPESILETLLNQYDKDKNLKLTKAEIGLDDETFAQKDHNKDGVLSLSELLAWKDGPPDLEVKMTIGNNANQSKCESLPPRNGKQSPLGVLQKGGLPSSSILNLGSQQITFQALASVNSRQPRDTNFPDFANLLGMINKKKQDYLTEGDLVGPQFQLLRILYETLDRDGDGRITQTEYTQFFKMQSSFLATPMTLQFAIQRPSLFHLIDANGDNRLSLKELKDCWNRLKSMEPSGADHVTRAAIQPHARIQFGRSAELTFQPQNVDYFARPRSNVAGPIWFQKMDRNGDEEISRDEFLGTKADFDRMDTNQDQRISLEEATAADKQMRTTKK